MFKFFLKKNFADGWDNMFFIIISNVFSIVALVLGFYGIRLTVGMNPLVSYAMLLVAGGLLMTVIFAYGANAAKIANFDTGSFGTFFRAFTYVWKIGFSSGVLITLLVLLVRFGIIYYLNMHNSFGFIMIAFLGWFLLIVVMALQWFVPLYFLQEQNNFKKCLKKSFVIFFDNPSFSVGVFFYNILLFALSCGLFFLVPGFSGLTLSCTNALRLRLKKYDWLEEECKKDPEFINDRDKRYNVPWSELIADDVETLGPRNWKSFIFPWK